MPLKFIFFKRAAKYYKSFFETILELILRYVCLDEDNFTEKSFRACLLGELDSRMRMRMSDSHLDILLEGLPFLF